MSVCKVAVRISAGSRDQSWGGAPDQLRLPPDNTVHLWQRPVGLGAESFIGHLKGVISHHHDAMLAWMDLSASHYRGIGWYQSHNVDGCGRSRSGCCARTQRPDRMQWSHWTYVPDPWTVPECLGRRPTRSRKARSNMVTILCDSLGKRVTMYIFPIIN